MVNSCGPSTDPCGTPLTTDCQPEKHPFIPTLCLLSGPGAILELLNNNICVDFLNTFLSLPVFGQTPVYVLKDKSWELQPNLPSNLTENMDGFLKWLEEHRLPHFLKTDLYLHLVLCHLLLDMAVPLLTVSRLAVEHQESSESLLTLQFSEDSPSSSSLSSKTPDSDAQLVQEPSNEEAQMGEMRDQWLLRRCIGSVRGMKCFRSFLMGTNGAELVEFWMRMERMRKLDETDINQRDQYFAQLRTIQATHLQEGSVVMSTCGGFTDVPLLKSKKPFRTRRDFLVKLQKQVLEKLKGYWLPRFLTHCKQSLRKVKEYGVIIQEYQGKVSQRKSPSPILTMSITHREGITQPYFTKAHKHLLWRLPYCKGKPTKTHNFKAKEQRDSCQAQPRIVDPKSTLHSFPKQDESGCSSRAPQRVPCSTEAKDKGATNMQSEYVFPQLGSSIPLIKAPSMLQCRRFPELPQHFRYLHWAFNADLLAGEPFATFLRVSGNLSKLQYLCLWHEMGNFLSIVLSVKDRAGYLLRKIVAEKIVEVYLTENSNQYTNLQVATTENLKTLLPSGQVIPWIFAAQKEICETLQETYDEFLDEEDKSFLNLVAGSEPNDPSSWTECKKLPTPTTDAEDLFIRRMARALLLSQACTAVGDSESLTDEDWKLLVTEDTANLGSMLILPKPSAEDANIKSMTFEELALKYPKLAVEELSKNFHRYYKKMVLLGLLNKEILREELWKKLNMGHLKLGDKILTRPKGIPRKLADVLTDPIGIHFFQRFLEIYDAEPPLQFWQAVENLQNLTTANERKLYTNWVINNFFNKNVNPEELLQCSSQIIRQIMEAIENGKPVTMSMLLQAQSEVQKSLQSWFELYLKTYPAESQHRMDSSVHIFRSIHTLSRTNRAWKKLQKMIKMVILFLRMMKTPHMRQMFESFLRDEVYNDKENMTTSHNQFTIPSMANSLILRVSDYGEDAEVPQIRKRVVCGRPVIINYLVNDLHFCMEIQHYIRRSEAAIIMARMGMHDDIYEGLLRARVAMIFKLFLQADNPPRLRVNISEYEKDRILMATRHGVLEPYLFHSARMAVIFPLLHFWKRFCFLNALTILGQPIGHWRREYVPPDYLKPSLEFNFYEIIPALPGEEFPILRFTLAKGIQILIPQQQETVENDTSSHRNSTSDLNPVNQNFLFWKQVKK
ncbi:regulator of G-protein signaling protein-like isoform X2 [Mobula hypostoma]|uniref:regulator of G-protein signaling protein-like isoform X2 n=1 Tax=Mobula hypostoma TaxID=723540 RepID=UPI002FC34EFC